MTNQEQMITPPQLVEQWVDMLSLRSDYAVFSLAAQWGWDQHRAATEAELQQRADQELEACEQAILDQEWFNWPEPRLAQLRAARRPKPLSLKEQALQSVKRFESGQDLMGDLDTIRRALEALPND